MQKRILGTGGPELSVIGLGTWAIGGPWKYGWGRQDNADSEAALEASLNAGINWVDTAAVYGLGEAERLLGKFCKRQALFIATKGGLVWDAGGDITKNLSADSIIQEAENSLTRLGVDCIDLYQLHWPDPKRSAEPAWEALYKLKNQGKIRYAGLSNFWLRDMPALHQIQPVQSLQCPLSMVERSYVGGVLPWCGQNGVGVLAYSPMQAGLLSGSFNREKLNHLPPDDWRKNARFFKDPVLKNALHLVDNLRPLAKELNCTVGQLAIAYVISLPGVTAAIAGARNAQQAQSNAKAASLQLAEQHLQQIERAIAAFEAG